MASDRVTGRQNPLATVTGALFSKLGIEENERPVVIWGALALALLGWCDVTLQNASETIFLKRVGVEYLPLAFLASSLLLVLSTALVGKLIVSKWRPNLLPQVFGGLAVALLPVWLFLFSNMMGAFVVLMLVAKQVKAIALLAFWVAFGRMLNARQTKRLAGPLIAGLTVGTIAGSFVSQPAGQLWGIDGLIAISAVLLGVASVVTIVLEKTGVPRLERGLESLRIEPSKTSQKDLTSWRGSFDHFTQLWKTSGLFRLLFLSVAASGTLVPMLYFQFSYTADMATTGAGAEQQLLALYAQLRGWMNIAIVFIQLLLASHLYRLIGVPLAVALSPVIYLIGFAGLSIDMTIAVGISAVAAARVQDKAIYDPAIRILYNLLRSSIQSKSIALLEGPTRWIGSTVGNVIALVALYIGGVVWVGYLAFPLALSWLIVSLILWRLYPTLLMRASSDTTRNLKLIVSDELFDQATISSLSENLISQDQDKCKAAIALISDAPIVPAVESLTQAALDAPPEGRTLLLDAIDQVLARSWSSEVVSSQAAINLVKLFQKESLSSYDRLIVAQGVAMLAGQLKGQIDIVHDMATSSSDEAIRLAGTVALYRAGQISPDQRSIDDVLQKACERDNTQVRKIVGRELKNLLMESEEHWDTRLELLGELVHDAELRVEIAGDLAHLATKHGVKLKPVAESLTIYKHDDDHRVRTAIMSFAGSTKLMDQAGWLAENLGTENEKEALAAREALLSMGPGVANALMIELSFGKRNTSEAVLAIIKEMKIQKDRLTELYNREINQLREMIARLAVLRGIGTTIEPDRPQLSQLLLLRLQERIEEGLHASLLLITAIHDDNRIAELAELIRHSQESTQKGILLEALETLLTSQEADELVPLLDGRDIGLLANRAVKALKTTLPSFNQAAQSLLNDPDELTIKIARSTLPSDLLGDQMSRKLGSVDDASKIEVALTLRSIQMFENLTTRHLIYLADVAREEKHPSGSTIVRENEKGDAMFVIVDGEVEVLKGGSELGRLNSGDCFGEMAVLEEETRSATVSTLTETKLFRIEADDLLALMNELPGIAICICQFLSKRLQNINMRIENIVLGRAETAEGVQ